MKKVFCALLSLVLAGILSSGCSSAGSDILTPPVSSPALSAPISASSAPETPSEPPASVLPQSREEKYVVVQDYADSLASRHVLEPFAGALNTELAEADGADDRLSQCGKEQFILNSAVFFEQGVLICGHILQDGEDYPRLYYLEGSNIVCRAEDSDCWSLNYTVFKNHTIAYGESIGWGSSAGEDNRVIMLDHVTAEFANGQKAEQNFPNIPFKNISSEAGQGNWPKNCMITDGYILVADDQTWIKNIGFYSHDGTLWDDWHSDQFRFSVLGSSSAYVWRGQPNEIWTIYRYTQMLNADANMIMNEISELYPISVRANGQKVELHPFLLSETIGLETIWRNNNSYISVAEVSHAAGIDIQGLSDNDEVLWVALDLDDGSVPSDYKALCSSEPPTKEGNYCLLIHHDGNSVLKHETMYYTLFVRLTKDA